MNQSSFATKFEKKLKPRVAKDLRVYAQDQCYFGDFLTPYGNIIEMKLRKIDDNEKNPGFIAHKEQYVRIMRDLGHMRWDINSIPVKPTFSYLFIPYSCKKRIRTANTVDEIIDEMTLSNAFLVDNKFVPEHDISGKDSEFYKLPVKTLEKNIQKKRKIKLLGADVFLNTVYDNYLSDIVTALFG
jgi:hypothetical protein